MPSHTYTSVILQQGVVISFHNNSHNEQGSCNLLVSLTPAHGPILWIEDQQGSARCPDISRAQLGTLLGNPARFDPRALHCTVVSTGHASDGSLPLMGAEQLWQGHYNKDLFTTSATKASAIQRLTTKVS